MKKILFAIAAILIVFQFSFAQEEEQAKPKDKPVNAPFESGILIDNQTNVIPTKNTLEMLIQHRFGKMNNGIKDVWGIYSPGANIRIGFNYSILDNLSVGYGLTKKNMYSDFSVKWNALTQTRKNTIPLSVTLYGNMAIDGSPDSKFQGDGEDSAYVFSNRLCYFSQVIVGRKFNDWISLQATASFTHYNKVIYYKDHDIIGVGFNGRIKFSPQSAFIFQYDAPLKIKGISEQLEFTDHPLPNLAFGYELSTGTHAFQIYITTADGILPQDIYMYNSNEWQKGTQSLMFGFTMTRLWGF
ncbi:MAG: DUF5777 family beta-barrel protein [Bacteroidales bacterium]|nr:DUF5777 family beta-barrel protein [Bacteroidales bacterium]MCF8404733.1 DUF5777 family beta-barrel protein [Bacteroidales bacterium]